MAPPGRLDRRRQIAVHSLRVALFAVIVALIHRQYTLTRTADNQRPFARVDVDRVKPFFADAESVSEQTAGDGSRDVLDGSRSSLGQILQTSPDSDHIIGFSGPTNVLIAFGTDGRIRGIDILSSGDTRDHLAQVQQDQRFLDSYLGLTWEDAASKADVDGVSGATLTSLAIRESIMHRLGGGRPSLRFPEPLTASDARRLFPAAAAVTPDEKYASLWRVDAEDGAKLGRILRTSPFADNIVGYQGPTDTLIGFDPTGKVAGVAPGKSYDNEPYVGYVREDEYFRTLFNGRRLDDLATLDLLSGEVEGVSGATMTSLAIAEGLVSAAREHRAAKERAARPAQPLVAITTHDFGTFVVIVAALLIGMTSLRSKRWVRVPFQLLLIGYLGLTAGNMVSMAMLVGWAQSGIAWRTAPGLVMLTVAALLLPITTRRNLYCSQICPHGAAQQLLKRRLPWQLRLPKRVARIVALIPTVLLAWSVVVAMTALPFSLVDIEPFDAWVFRVAGWATIAVAVVGLVASLFVPMAYCRYGCPTGALLNFFRFHARSDRWTRRDWVASGLVGLALCLSVT